MNPQVDLSAHRRRGADAAGYLMLAGAAFAAVSVALHPEATSSNVLLVELGALCIVIGACLLQLRHEPPEWVLGLAAASGTVIITVATSGGERVDSGTVDSVVPFVMPYIWVCLLAFSFLGIWHALFQLALIGACYAFLLQGEPVGEATTRWVISLSSLLVAGLLVYRLQKARSDLVDELSQRASRDGLTGLLNRAALEERAVLELERSKRLGTPLSLIVLDIDAFKSLNDSMGHPVGDQTLRQVATSLMEETREVDAVARLGGDEFGALLPGAALSDALRVAKRLVGDGGGSTSISIGVAQATFPEDTFDGLWQRADSAMYAAKRDGGGVVRTSDDSAPSLDQPALSAV